MQLGDIIGVVVAGLVMFFPLYLLHTSDLASNPANGGFGGPNLAAPQAGLMAALSQGIVGGEMAWPLVRRRHRDGDLADPDQGPLADALLGRHVPAARDDLRDLRRRPDPRHRRQARRGRGFNDAQKARVENAGVLVASGLIAGEALMGLVVAGVVASRADKTFPTLSVVRRRSPRGWRSRSRVVLVLYMVRVPISKAGGPTSRRRRRR